VVLVVEVVVIVQVHLIHLVDQEIHLQQIPHKVIQEEVVKQEVHLSQLMMNQVVEVVEQLLQVETQVSIVVEMVEQEHQTILQEQQRLTLAVVVEVLLVVQVDLAELVEAEMVETIHGLQEQLDLQLLEKMQL
tara:strand:- start:107 stop:505 length:399 start_codon:yes stop_codon:yes gene_type:complete